VGDLQGGAGGGVRWESGEAVASWGVGGEVLCFRKMGSVTGALWRRGDGKRGGQTLGTAYSVVRYESFLEGVGSNTTSGCCK